MKNATAVISFLAVMFFAIATAAAKEVVIVTSFPKELFETHKKAFEAKNPGINVTINRPDDRYLIQGLFLGRLH